MKEFYTDDYKSLIKQSLLSQTQRTFSTYGMWKDTHIFTTSLDCGRQTGKTNAIVSLSEELGGVVIYVGHTLQAAEHFKALGGRASIYASKSTITNSLKANRVAGNQITIIFDECDLTTTDMLKVAHCAKGAMLGNGTWRKYVHVIRLGM